MRCDAELSVGAYVLDALEPAEQLRMQEHVATCPVCAETARELEGLPRLLAGVPEPGDAPTAPVPSELAFERFRRSAVGAPAPGIPAPRLPAITVPAAPAPLRTASSARHRSPSRRRTAPWRLVAAAAALVVVGGVSTGIAVAGRDDPPTVVEAASGDVQARASLTAAGDGTRVVLALDGVPFGSRCELVAVARNGSQESAGDWAVSYSGTFHWTGWIGLPPDQLDRLVVRTLDGRTLVTVPG